MSMELAAERRLADLREDNPNPQDSPPLNRRSGFPSRYARFGEFQLDAHREELLKKDARQRVPGKVFQVLVALLERPGEVVTREDLRARLWASDTHVNFEANVNTTVNKLRQFLGDSNERSTFVQTIPRRGYCFIAPVEFQEQPEFAPDPAMRPAGDAPDSAEAAAVPAASLSSRLFGPQRSAVWFTAGVIALVAAAMLFGAALTLFSYHRL